jgi:type III secretory pathway component EscU
MKKWYETSASEKLTDEQRSEMWRDLRKELLHGWLIVFVVQLLIGIYYLYQMWPELTEYPAWAIGALWVITSAIAATILVPIVIAVMFVAAAIVFAFMFWRESRREG